MKAKRRVVTSGPTPKRRPTVRRLKPAIAPAVRRPAPAPPSTSSTNGFSVGSPVGPASASRFVGSGDLRSADASTANAEDGSTVDMSVDLGRGLVLQNPILVASGTFGYGVEYGDVVEIQRLGAICCKGTTLRPRVGNPTPRVT